MKVKFDITSYRSVNINHKLIGFDTTLLEVGGPSHAHPPLNGRNSNNKAHQGRESGEGRGRELSLVYAFLLLSLLHSNR